ncbi:hypothetical protein [Chitinimonas koreensis]|uniref:hypothetical protein n=1 Tax=Chitinimonas koreensis TaxID=356302 RepID=UPI00040AC3F7|nr:hypothetical protein [Chitinimonas koreensis]QNM97076.1 hypothetical protein H9L41_01700 [Chitinimonas koreensis]
MRPDRLQDGAASSRAPVAAGSRAAWVYLAAAIAATGVAIHLAAILGGPAWYAFFGAPPRIVESARSGTWLAPASAAVIAGLMALCAAYALSALRRIRRLPLLRPMLAAMAGVCLLRALILPPLAIGHPELRNAFEFIAAAVWGLAGIGFAVGFRLARTAPAGRRPGDAR